MLFSALGCNKALDLKPLDTLTPETFFTKESDAYSALNGAFDILTRINVYGGYFQYRMLNGDDTFTRLTGTYPANQNFTAAEPQWLLPLWTDLWQIIERANIVLENLPKVPMTAAHKDAVTGEALFLRAYVMFMLVDLWGPIPIKLTATAGANDVARARQPIKDVYAQILSDMTAAEKLVPTTADPQYGGAAYPAKTTIEGILARVCLTMAGEPLKDVSKYQDAKDWAQKVVSSGEHRLNPDYTDIFIKLASDQYDKKESMWEIDLVGGSGSSEGGLIGYLSGIPGGALQFGLSNGEIHTTRKLYNLYGATSNDKRRDWNCSTFAYKNTTTTGADADKTFFTATQIYDRWDAKFRNNYQPYAIKVLSVGGVNFPLLRYADVMLMLAEAENQLNGPTALAYSMINQVRARAYGKLLPGATNPTEADLPAGLDKLSFLKEIQDERCRELVSEALRRHDLIRWGIYVSSMQEVKADANNSVLPAVTAALKNQVTAIANATTNRNVLWPIPASEISLNPEMTQNEGW